MNTLMMCLFLTSFVSWAAEVYTWKDGSVERKIYLKENTVMSFEKTSKAPVLKTMETSLFQEKLSAKFSTRESPVFSDSPSGEELRSLPGGVIVTFKNEVSLEAQKQWAQDHNLILKEKINSSQKNIWLIETPSGLESLNISNQLASMPEVESATPNWWVKKELKILPKDKRVRASKRHKILD